MTGSCFLFPLFFLLSSFLLVYSTSSARTPFDIPSPRFHDGWVADPDGFLSHTLKQEVDNQLTTLERRHKFEVAVVIINKMKITEFWTDSDVVQKFSKLLFDRWKIGKRETNNGVLFFISVQDRKMRLQTGAGAKETLTDYECELIIDEIKTFLRGEHYDDAVRHATRRIISILSGETSSRSRSIGFLDIVFVSILLFILGLFCYGCYSEFKTRSRRSSFEKRLQKLKESEVLLPQLLEGEKCGICLDDLKNKKATKLQCRHMFHEECVVEWLDRKNDCPVCRKVDPLGVGASTTNRPTTTTTTTTQPEPRPLQPSEYWHHDDPYYGSSSYRPNFFDNILDANLFLFRDVSPSYTLTRSLNSFAWRYSPPSTNSGYGQSGGGSSGFGGGSSSGGGGASGDW